MQKVRGYYKHGKIELFDPIEGLEDTEVIVIVSNDLDNNTALEKKDKTRKKLSHLQMQTGFIQTVLASEEEDVWNDL